jgi:hypothetical protein
LKPVITFQRFSVPLRRVVKVAEAGYAGPLSDVPSCETDRPGRTGRAGGVMSQGRWTAAAFVFVTGVVGAPPARATDLNLRLESGGATTVSVAPGTVLTWAAVGELSDGLNQGLALFSLDLQWTGGALPPASAPSASPMLNFARPAGLNNPAGFGGTAGAQPGRLLQVGGAQNTIANAFAPYPAGAVMTGVALPGQPATLASGQLTAPALPGTYTLTASNLVANVLRLGETGVPFWRVDKAGPGSLVPLTVQVTGPSSDDDRARAKPRIPRSMSR